MKVIDTHKIVMLTIAFVNLNDGFSEIYVVFKFKKQNQKRFEWQSRTYYFFN